MIRHCLLSTLLVVLIAATSTAQEANYRREFGFKSENDAYLFYGQDRYYTNGLFITYRQAVGKTEMHRRLAKQIWQLEAGQSMYNPRSGSISRMSSIDRPFAAYLYGGGSFNWFFKNESLLKASLQVGTIGPSAKGKEAQESLHQALGFYPINGWEYQVKDELGINSALTYTRLLSRSKNGNTDFNFSGRLLVGNTFSGAEAGITFRAGDINSLFQSAITNSRISNGGLNDTVPGKELFFFTRPALSFVAYNATIQGGMFRDDKGPVTFSPKRLVYSQELGLMYAKNRWSLNFSVIFKTKEVKSAAKADQYGSASVFYRFN